MGQHAERAIDTLSFDLHIPHQRGCELMHGRTGRRIERAALVAAMDPTSTCRERIIHAKRRCRLKPSTKGYLDSPEFLDLGSLIVPRLSCKPALVDVDGSTIKGRKASRELRSYVYEAWMRRAGVCVELDKLDHAKELRAKAAALVERFSAAS